MEKFNLKLGKRWMVVAGIGLAGLMLMAACNSSPQPIPTATVTTLAAGSASIAAGANMTATNTLATTGGTAVTSGTVPAGKVVEVDPLPLNQALPPVRMRIPALNLDLPVQPMGWRVVTAGDTRTTVWDVPENAVGWHVNSAGAGGAGNTVLSGRQADGGAVFKPLALGNIQPGQDVYLTDKDGLTFAYRITTVTDPIPITGATTEDQKRAAAYLGQTDKAKLTLVTGWPEFTTTHRVFALADFVGVMK